MNLNSIDTIQIRKFGAVALVFFGALFVLGLWMKKPIPVFLFGFLAIVGISFILFPERQRPIYVAWLSIAGFLGKIVTGLALTIAFFVVITPSALIKRVFGGRPLPVKPDKDVSTYWVERSEPSQPKERFIKRY